MDSHIWIALIATAIGTCAMRVLPLLYMQRQLLGSGEENRGDLLPTWLRVLGPTMIAAMFGTSLVPASGGVASWCAAAAGLFVTFVVWRRTKSLGWPILAGVIAYGLVKILAGAVA